MPGEWETMVKGDRHSTILWWVLLAVKRAHYAGHTTDVELEKCAEAVSLMRAQANDLMSSLDRDIPYPYASLVGALVRINVFLMSLWKSTELYLMFCGMTGIGPHNWGTAHSLNPQCLIPNPQVPAACRHARRGGSSARSTRTGTRRAQRVQLHQSSHHFDFHLSRSGPRYSIYLGLDWGLGLYVLALNSIH